MWAHHCARISSLNNGSRSSQPLVSTTPLWVSSIWPFSMPRAVFVFVCLAHFTWRTVPRPSVWPHVTEDSTCAGLGSCPEGGKNQEWGDRVAQAPTLVLREVEARAPVATQTDSGRCGARGQGPRLWPFPRGRHKVSTAESGVCGRQCSKAHSATAAQSARGDSHTAALPCDGRECHSSAGCVAPSARWGLPRKTGGRVDIGEMAGVRAHSPSRGAWLTEHCQRKDSPTFLSP